MQTFCLKRSASNQDNADEWHFYEQMSHYMPRLTELYLKGALLDHVDLTNISRIKQLKALTLRKCYVTFGIAEAVYDMYANPDAANDNAAKLLWFSDGSSIFAKMNALQRLTIFEWELDPNTGVYAISPTLLIALESALLLNYIHLKHTPDVFTRSQCEKLVQHLSDQLKLCLINHHYYVGNAEIESDFTK